MTDNDYDFQVNQKIGETLEYQVTSYVTGQTLAAFATEVDAEEWMESRKPEAKWFVV
jgi:hypothetical protein